VIYFAPQFFCLYLPKILAGFVLFSGSTCFCFSGCVNLFLHICFFCYICIMAWTIEDYNELKKAYMSGALRVKYADKEVEYRSLLDMRKLLDEAEDELGLNTCSRLKYISHGTSKGTY
jgi:hypothetical protein